jgi:FtsZ-binding cell division protein ZapB
MDNPIDQLLGNAIACSTSLRFACDQYEKALSRIREASIKCENDLAAKVAVANETIANLRAEIQSLREDKMKAEREVAVVKAEKEKELKKYTRFIDEARAKTERVLGPQTVAA